MKLEKNGSISNAEAPLFSVIVLTHLQRHLLNGCLDSILSQTYPRIEIVVCDDGSADFDPDEVLAYITSNKRSNLKRVIVYRQEESVGWAANAQMGVELSSGAFFKFHSGGDVLCDGEVLEDMCALLRSGAPLVAARAKEMGTAGCLPSEENVAQMAQADARTQFGLLGCQEWGEYVHPSAVFWTRTLFDRLGGLDPAYQQVKDQPLWLKATRDGCRITMADRVAVRYHRGEGGPDHDPLCQAPGQTCYDERIRMFQEIILPEYEKTGNRKKLLSYQHRMRCLEASRDIEGHWQYWSFWKKALWRLGHLGLFFMSWLRHARWHGTDLRTWPPLLVMAVCALMYRSDVEIWPSVDSGKIWSAVFLGAFVVFVITACMKLAVKAIRILAGHGGERK